MQRDFQTKLFEIIKLKIKGQDSLGHVISEVLCISQDATYRRFRGETLLTINELEKLCRHFNISSDELFQSDTNKVVFQFQPLKYFDFSMDGYLQGMLSGLEQIRKFNSPELIISINNTPFLQLLNFPHLIRYKLFFWAKTYLQVPEYQNMKYKHDKISEQTFSIGKEILRHYNAIPSRELYDPGLLRGFTREILYNLNAQHFEDPEYVFFLLDSLEKFLDHLKDQASVGKKFIYGTQPPAEGNNFEMYYNETFNSITSIYYQAENVSGLYIAHNLMNSLHTMDSHYLEESKNIMEKQLANSSMISIVNEKERNRYFNEIKMNISQFRKKMEAELNY